MLFGKTFLPDYPQCEPRLARFRGIDKTEFLDQRQRVDRPLIPPGAMREILVNALIHRDYTIAGGAVSLAIFDDRVEVWSAGRYPAGITPELLSRSHPSVQRNPVIADVFHRAGLIEKWGRGTNRVGEMCKAAGIAPPEFAEIGGAAVATFRVPVAPSRGRSDAGAESRAESGAESRAESLDARVLAVLGGLELSTAEIAERLRLRTVSGQLNRTIRSLVDRGLLVLTIPAKPTSRLQRYRLSGAPARADS